MTMMVMVVVVMTIMIIVMTMMMMMMMKIAVDKVEGMIGEGHSSCRGLCHEGRTLQSNTKYKIH